VVRVAGAGRAASMSTVNAQPGIFALGTPEHAYLEFDLAPGTPPVELVRAAAGLVDPLSTTGGVNLVVGFRPELWAEVADPADVPASTQGWAEPLVGPDGWSMPATQQDAFLWVAGGNRTAVFDNGRAVVRALAPVARLCRETDGWTYRHDRDLTGFIDGTENPSLLTAPAVALVPAGSRARAAAHGQDLEIFTATPPPAPSPRTAPRSSGSAPSRGGWRRCCAGWPVSATASATR
jgi:porphyrinogen peroxidase